MSRIRRVLHPTDFSRASTAAFKRAVEMAKGNRAELLLVHVMVPAVPLMGDGYVSPKVYEDLEAAARSAAQKQLRKLVDKAKQAGARVKGLLLEGVAHERIAQAARSRKADLVVIGTHGRTGFAKLFLGSVASRVLAVSPCPVLTVRGK
ncbi:MAG TPA: universal stress protein [Methylomirabilota bacterium]|jgi:nucleotide-binding universal stress UspA family protein|nr:universal stress protein [Methylomirabilota bacterium]